MATLTHSSFKCMWTTAGDIHTSWQMPWVGPGVMMILSVSIARPNTDVMLNEATAEFVDLDII